mmetsp:Transcript_8104/g.17463  ORF Transcript_8104/g.17463 Transcript_8104/m.17463 type:complete len:250 (+) Transcript_8104:212-961(+)
MNRARAFFFFVLSFCICRDIIAQVVAARLAGDEVVAVAHAHELPRYGVKLGLTNFASAYCVGLLVARRVLKKMGLDETYAGAEEVTGEMFEVEPDEDKRPFRALLDIGIVTATTGHKVFAVMKGAVDGGLDVPHNEKRFPAYTKEEGFDPEILKSHIMGEHVAEYMELLADEDEDRYKEQFGRYIKEGITHEDIAEIYENAHTAIRENPDPVKSDKPVPDRSKYKQKKATPEERKANISKRITELLSTE